MTPQTLKKRREAGATYGAHRIAAFAGVSGQRVGQWARNGLISASVYQGKPAHLYSTSDASEAIVIRWLVEEGFSYAKIHHAIDQAAEKWPDWPLLTAPLGVAKHAVKGDPRGLLVLRGDQGEYLDTSGDGDQIVLKPHFLHDVRAMLSRGGWIAAENQLTRITVDPRTLNGAPAIEGSRWSVDRVAQLAADSEGRAVLLDDYGLKDAEIDEAVVWVSKAQALVG